MEILLVPTEQGGLRKSKGSSEAPSKVIELLRKPSETIQIIKSNLEETHQSIYDEVLKHDEAILIGGDHSITFSAFKAFQKNNPDAGIIIFDAHPDCVNNFQPVTHEDFVRVLVEENILAPEKIILVGIRNSDPIESEFLKKHNIRYFSMKQIYEQSPSHIADTITETASTWSALYLSIDIDVVDPAFAPGTGYVEPGGLTSREMLYFIQRLKELRNLKMVDLVEISPEKDINNLTVTLGKKIVQEFL